METIKSIIKDIDDDHFSILVDESRDVSCKEQMTIVPRYVDRRGSVIERFMGIVHVRDTSALSLRNEIVNLLAQHSLSPSSIRRQCYDGASNMQGDLNGLKILMQKESRGAHSIHCFAHQLQLTLVAISRRCDQVQELLLLLSDILNMVGSSFKLRDELRESQAEEIEEALRKGELETGKGLNQELGLARAGDTRWGSHYKSFNNFIIMFGPIIDALDAIAVNERFEEKCKAKGYLKACLTFEVVFTLHLMRTVLEIINELNAAFQKKEQDIANAMLLVGVTNDHLQTLRKEGWNSLIDEVSKFCIKYDIFIPKFDELYVIPGRSRRRVSEYTISQHYRVELQNYIVDVRDHDKRFSGLKGLGDLSIKLVETKKHGTYPLVFQLVKFALLLPVATATVERTFSFLRLTPSPISLSRLRPASVASRPHQSARQDSSQRQSHFSASFFHSSVASSLHFSNQSDSSVAFSFHSSVAFLSCILQLHLDSSCKF
uniref:Zinc finger MYM-type protein 1-like n=1 Tax=Nicotiana sylvestris TaxID=4096 RepID=A0A1U7WKC1_NICSY|nr:PREDICTED: zinc finger MYM-type protein 1-like [Nicotiana sylvestris]